jgi:Effector-associated domain 2
MHGAPVWTPVDPGRAHAVVVGIEAYQAGDSWDLDGPAEDALRFVTWLTDSGVPPHQITALVSPLRRNAAGLSRFPVRVLPADRHHVQDVLLREVPGQAGDLLWVVWGGHGFIDGRRRRRLFYADATAADSRNLDIDSLLATFGSDFVPSFDRQIWMVDACQLPVEQLDGARALPNEEFAHGRLRPERDQDVMFAARPGESAVNLASQRTGLFTREVLRAFGPPAPAAWPPEPDLVVAALRRRFVELRGTGQVRQTPTYFWHRGRGGDEGQVMYVEEPRVAVAAAVSPGGTERAPFAKIAAVVDALTRVAEFERPTSREEILTLIRREVSSAIPRQSSARLDALAIVRTCLRYEGGLAELVDAVRFFAAGTIAMASLDQAASALIGDEPDRWVS